MVMGRYNAIIRRTNFKSAHLATHVEISQEEEHRSCVLTVFVGDAPRY